MFLKANELGGERLHKIGSAEATRASNAGPVIVACALRGDMLSDKSHGWSIEEMANSLDHVITRKGVIEQFKLHRHDALLGDVNQRAAQTGCWQPHRVRYNVLKEIMYRNDPQSMFGSLPALHACISDHNKEVVAARDQDQNHPLADASRSDAPEEVKRDALLIKAAMRHFKDTTTDMKDMFTFPVSALGGAANLSSGLIGVRPPSLVGWTGSLIDDNSLPVGAK